MARRKHSFVGLSMTDAELMAATLLGLEHQRSQIEEKMAEVRRAISRTAFAGSGVPRKKRRRSAAVRQRMAAAQQKRWAAVRKAKKATEK